MHRRSTVSVSDVAAILPLLDSHHSSLIFLYIVIESKFV